MRVEEEHLISLRSGDDNSRQGFRPFFKYVALLITIVLLYSALFHFFMEREGQSHSLLTGLYWTLTVMTTLGFGDITFHSDAGRVFSSVVLLTGVVLLLILLPFLFIRTVYAPWLDQRNRARIRTVRRLPRGVSGHVIISSNDPLALALMKRLSIAGIPAYVIEQDPELALRMRDAGLPVVAGDVDSGETYMSAGAGKASLIFANGSDPENSNTILTVRENSPRIPIVALAEADESVEVLGLCGADHVLPLKRRLGEHLANRVSAGIFKANVIGRFHDLFLAEFPVHDTPLQGRTIRTAGLRESIGVSIIGVWQQGRMKAARPDMELTPNCVPVVIGTEEQIDELNALLAIYNVNPNPVIVLGGGKVGSAAARALKARDVRVNMVEKNPSLADCDKDCADRIIVGDAADRRILEDAGIEHSPSILITTHDDAMNVYLTVYCRRLNPEARILSRVTHERNIEAIQRAGADFVLSYASLGVHTVLSIVQQRELIVLGEGADLFYIPLPEQLVGKTLAEAAIGEKCGLNVIAIQMPDGKVEPMPSATQKLNAHTTLVTIGTHEDNEKFNMLFG